MNKRILSIFLCVCLLMAFAVPVFADEVEEEEIVYTETIRINSLEAFLAFAESCRLDSNSQGVLVELKTDLDLSETEFESIPIFCGLFEGNGHTISGLELTADGSVQGLFRYLTSTAVVQNLKVQGTIEPSGSRGKVGGIVGSNEGLIAGCSFEGTVSGGSNVGGLVGFNGVTGIIEDCTVSGEVHGSHFVGGIAGENQGVIRNCINHALVNTTAQQNTVDISEITMDSLTNSEASNTVTDIGGIAGITSGVIRGCENHGNVGYQHMGYNIGGIAGTQSGYITECVNYGGIQGRKEVGGIVGQMEPISLIEYSEDTLQILQGQLETMSGLVNQTSTNAQSNASQITSQISALQEQTETAKDAVQALFPSEGETKLPDADAIQAAQNTLSTTINAMPQTVSSIASSAQATVSGLTRDLQAVSNQIGAMSATINGAAENLGGSITDISDEDTEELLAGKVEQCVNEGTVLADTNVGGIAGSLAFENDLDTMEDLEIIGDTSMNFTSQVRAVVLNCENHASVTAKKQNGGGIVGGQTLGLVKNCLNTGTVDAADAEYVGGVVGWSSSYIRSCYAKGEIYGGTYVGGIAGVASIATDCRSLVEIHDGTEKVGAILGYAEETTSDEEDPICGNLYLTVSEDLGAIDGISYSGVAESAMLSQFLALEDLPEVFKTATITFHFADGTERAMTVRTGAALVAEKIPELPEMDDSIGWWDGLRDEDMVCIMLDRSYDAAYTGHYTTIQSEALRENGLPILLVQGEFSWDAAVSVTASAAAPELDDADTLLEVWDVRAVELKSAMKARFQMPVDCDGENLCLLISRDGETWAETEFTVDGSYLVFAADGEDMQIALVQTAVPQWPVAAIGAGALLAVVVVILILRSRKKKDASKQKTGEEV